MGNIVNTIRAESISEDMKYLLYLMVLIIHLVAQQ